MIEKMLRRGGNKKGMKLGRRTIVASAASTVEFAAAGAGMPTQFRATVTGVELPDWIEANRDLLAARLLRDGGVLLRGFDVNDIGEFERAILAVGAGGLAEYEYRSTPRQEVNNRVYTSTEYPPDRHIPLHNECSYADSWPMKTAFFCARPAAAGGETPIADSRKVLGHLSAATRQGFAEKGVMYVRNYGGGLDLPWQEVFQTPSREEVEAYCQKVGMGCEWLGGDRLRTRMTCQALAEHPQTGEAVWFNQAHLFHVSSLPSHAEGALRSVVDEGDLPRNAYYGDGSPIAEAELREIREAYRRETVAFAWRRGDVLLLDNMLAAHGRTPFEGERKVYVAMAETYSPNKDDARHV